MINEKKQFMMVQYPLLGLKGKYLSGKPKPNDKIIIDDGEILLLSLIENLSNNKNRTQITCSASNAYITSVLNESERNIQRRLVKLKTIGIIKICEIRNSGSHKTTERLIYIQEDVINNILKEKNESETQEFTKTDTCLDEAHDNSGKKKTSTRQIWSEHTTDLVEAHDNSGRSTCQICHPNNNNNTKIKEKYNNSGKNHFNDFDDDNDEENEEPLMPF